MQDALFGAKETASILAQLSADSKSKTEIFKPENAPVVGEISREMRKLIVSYCARFTKAYELSEVDFGELALRLGVRMEHLKQSIEIADRWKDKSGNERTGCLWGEVIQMRVKTLNAARAFRDSSWEMLESKTLSLLTELAEAGAIRDTGELLAIASHARKINVHEAAPQPAGGNHVSINFNGNGNELPPSGSTMTIDLSPRLAASLADKSERPTGDRVIDGQMLSAQELRDALASQLSPVIDMEGDSHE